MTTRDELCRRLAKDPDVRFALLFGSRVGGRPRPDSDWDVAVYLDDALSARERFRVRTRLAAELEETGPVDVVVLNDADPLLAHRALQGELLDVEDRSAYVRFFVRTLALAGDRRHVEGLMAGERRRRLADGTYGRP